MTQENINRIGATLRDLSQKLTVAIGTEVEMEAETLEIRGEMFVRLSSQPLSPADFGIFRWVASKVKVSSFSSPWEDGKKVYFDVHFSWENQDGGSNGATLQFGRQRMKAILEYNVFDAEDVWRVEFSKA